MLYYSEIFSSIQGEGLDTGLPTIFVRLYGCNVGCSYCDTVQTPKDRKRISLDNIVKEVTKYKIPNVCITGGEPLLQPDVYPLIYELQDLGYKVSVETSGCVKIEEDNYRRSFKYVMDVKCPSSGVSQKNKLDNLSVLHANDEVKFVIGDREDYLFARKILRSYPTQAKILFSPVFKDGAPVLGSELVDWILEDCLFYVRIQLQIHKYLNIK
jgi:7-carboxy-7-deazaguanine synthase